MVLFTLSMSIKAQEDFFEQKRAEYKYATPEEKPKLILSLVISKKSCV